ncbi:hypothetical protein, partial [Acinetobacter pittii]|uniref:hypothetical protein n=1 Tax=Acinetobacter pittii TaxID=48296 RepID=UPI00202A8210
MNFQTILLSFKNQSTGTDAFKDLKNACEQSLKESQDTKEKAAVYLIYGFARSYVILYEDEAVTTEFAHTSKTQLIAYMESEPYRVCRRVNILRDYPDDKTKLYPR